MSFALGAADIAVIVCCLSAVVLVGLWASRRRAKTARDYFLASGKLPWWIIGASFVATSVSSEQIVGTIGAAYEHGMSIANWEWWAFPCYVPLIVIFIPIYLKNRITTVPELMSKRFAPLCGGIYSWTIMIAYVLIFLVPVLYGGSLTFAALTGINFYIILWGMVFLVALYTVKGGLASVVWADVVQCTLLVGGGILLFFLALGRVEGGWSAMVEANPDRFHLYRPPNDPVAPFAGLIAGTFGLFVFYQAANQVMVQRVLAARSTWDGIMGIIFAGFINFLRPLVTCFLGFVVFHWIHVMRQAEPLDNLDTAFPFAIRMLAPTWGLRGIVLAGFLAAVMSTISALANSTATIFSLDIYKRLIDKRADDKRVVTVGRIAAFSALVIAALVAPSVEHLGGIFRYFQKGVTYVSTPFISVILLGILWKRTTRQGALFGLIGGFAIQLGVVAAAYVLELTVHWLYLGLIAEIITVLGIVGISLLTPPPPREQWEPFLWRPALLARYDEGVARPWYASLKLWFIIFGAVFLVLYWHFW